MNEVSDRLQEVQEILRRIWSDPDPAYWLGRADDNIKAVREKQRLRKPGQRVAYKMPSGEAWLFPFVLHYSTAPDAFLALVRTLRDREKEIAGASEQYAKLHALYRSVLNRTYQAERRDRESRIRERLAQDMPQLDAAQRDLWINRISKAWSQELKARKASLKKSYGTRWSQGIETEVSREFWEIVDNRIAAGEFPPHYKGPP